MQVQILPLQEIIRTMKMLKLHQSDEELSKKHECTLWYSWSPVIFFRNLLLLVFEQWTSARWDYVIAAYFDYLRTSRRLHKLSCFTFLILRPEHLPRENSLDIPNGIKRPEKSNSLDPFLCNNRRLHGESSPSVLQRHMLIFTSELGSEQTHSVIDPSDLLLPLHRSADRLGLPFSLRCISGL